MSSNDWNTVSLGESGINIIDGDRGKNYPNGDDFTDKGYCLFLNAKNVTQNGFAFDQKMFITKEKSAQLRKGKLDRHDVIFTTRGTVGNVAYYSNKIPFENVRINSGMVILRSDPETILPKFLYYSFITPQIKKEISAIKTGSAQPQLPISVMKGLRISCPPLQEQKAIAHILSTLDDKIEVNNQINKTLEDMSQAIFKRWFVDFEFPNEDGEPYKSSGGEMVESELGMIPKGWKVGILQDLGKVVGGSTPSKKNEDYYTQEGIAWITPKDLSNNHDVFIKKGAIDISPEGLKNSSTFLLPKGSILFSSRAPIGYMAIADQELTTNQGFKSIIPGDQFGTSFVYCALNQMMEKIKSRASGSTFLEVSGSVMKSIETLLPETKIIQKFNELSNPLFKTIKVNENQIKRLVSCRDILLPKLMSGEIRVHE